MNERILEIYFDAFNRHGHDSANGIMGIYVSNFSVFSRIYDTEENIKNLELSEFGGLLYTDNPDFVKEFKSSIKNNISQEISVFSDLFNSTITILIFKQSDQQLKFIYEIPSKLVLRII
jgi:hypothetical protein